MGSIEKHQYLDIVIIIMVVVHKETDDASTNSSDTSRDINWT